MMKAVELFLGVVSACKFANHEGLIYLLLGVPLFYWATKAPEEGGRKGA